MRIKIRAIKIISFIIFLFILAIKLSIGRSHPSKPLANNQAAFLDLQKQLSKMQNVQGKFIQKRVIKVLSNPLISSGNFSLSKTKGLKWIQKKPFPLTLMLNTSVLTQTIENNPPMVLTKDKQPFVFSFSEIFLSIFKGDSNALNQSFTIGFHGDIKHWNMILKPKSFPLNKAIKSIELSGGKVIDLVIVNNVKHDQLIINFYDVKVTN